MRCGGQNGDGFTDAGKTHVGASSMILQSSQTFLNWIVFQKLESVCFISSDTLYFHLKNLRFSILNLGHRLLRVQRSFPALPQRLRGTACAVPLPCVEALQRVEAAEAVKL